MPAGTIRTGNTTGIHNRPQLGPRSTGATTIDGVISTRRGNGASWNIIIGKPPAGEWELSFKFDDPVKYTGIRNRFKSEEIWDILLVITYGGRTPAWRA